MHIVTSGLSYLDIDAYGGCIAYAELLRAQGFAAQAVSRAPLNVSITPTIRSWQAPLETDYVPNPDDTFSLVDVSDPRWFDPIVGPDRIESVIDHHVGFEQYWQERLGAKAHIEFIGAACTLVYEQWLSVDMPDKMTVLSARLLVSGILDNTLNFRANVTTRRDRDAYRQLAQRAQLPADWTAQYFVECQDAILRNLPDAIRNDTKRDFINSRGQSICLGQLVVWNAQTVLARYRQTIEQTMSALRPDWFMNLISTEEGKSYFLATSIEVQSWLSGILGMAFNDSIAVTDRLWLRKEVLKQDLEKAPSA